MSSFARPYAFAHQYDLIAGSYNADLPEEAGNGTNHEMVRLEKYGPVEYAITKRYLARYVPANSVVADVGVGTGHYSEFLARRGCRVHLVDVAERLLEAAQKRLMNAGLTEHILSITNASATNLSFLPDESCDAVLMLGPFYNLGLPEDRQSAAAEAHRILRPGGVFFAAGINIMTILKWYYSDFTDQILDKREWLDEYLKLGDLPHDPAIPSIWHMSTIATFRADFTAFRELALVGVESFAQGEEKKLLDLSPEQAESWLDLIEATGTTPEGLGCTGHFLFIGQK